MIGIDRQERGGAEQVSAAVDRLLQAPGGCAPGPAPVDEGVLATARRLSRLPYLLGPADPRLALWLQRRLAAVSTELAGGRRFTIRVPRVRWGWALAGAAALLLALGLFTPLGQTALAGFLAVFNLGRTELRITPASPSLATVQVSQTAVEQHLTAETAGESLPFALMQPGYLPPGYRLRDIICYVYPDMPPWVPQPFSAKLVYDDGQGHTLSLELYAITLGQGDSSISGMDLRAGPIQDVKDVDLDGRPGVLLQLGAPGGQTTWQELVWEQGNLMLALSSGDLPEADLLRVASSVK